MDARDLLKAGHLEGALEHLTRELKAHPNDTQRRTFLFELLCFEGEYDRAERQLEVLSHQNATAELGVHFYRDVLAAERARQRLLSSNGSPSFLRPPPAYVQTHLAALQHLRDGHPAAARELLEQAEEARPACSGSADGVRFADFRDADDLMAPCLEVIVNDRYVWLPIEEVRRLTVSPPKRLRDLLWISAVTEIHGGPEMQLLLPVTYIGSSAEDNDMVKLGRATEWRGETDGPTRGVGQRLFLVDEQDRAILELHQIEFDNVQHQA